MTTIYRWLGLCLAVLASVGMILIPASPADAAASSQYVRLRTYNVVVASFRHDPAIYRQLTSKVARLTPAQFTKVKQATRSFETRMKKPVKRVSDNGQMTEFSAQARPKIVVTPPQTLLERIENFFKLLKDALPFAALFIPAAATFAPIVVFVLVVIAAISAVVKGYGELRTAR
jgi:hypothetical protein